MVVLQTFMKLSPRNGVAAFNILLGLCAMQPPQSGKCGKAFLMIACTPLMDPSIVEHPSVEMVTTLLLGM